MTVASVTMMPSARGNQCFTPIDLVAPRAVMVDPHNLPVGFETMQDSPAMATFQPLNSPGVLSDAANIR